MCTSLPTFLDLPDGCRCSMELEAVTRLTTVEVACISAVGQLSTQHEVIPVSNLWLKIKPVGLFQGVETDHWGRC